MRFNQVLYYLKQFCWKCVSEYTLDIIINSGNPLGSYRNDFDLFLESRSDNFIIGLTNVSPTVTTPALWDYAVCCQYPGAVGAGATVNLTCTSDMPAYRYLIVQFPVVNDAANFCELEVYIRRKYLCRHSVIDWKYTDIRCSEAIYTDIWSCVCFFCIDVLLHCLP